MVLIFGASTDLGAPKNTVHLFRPILLWLFPHMSKETLDLIHHLGRKSAHFIEYAILGILAWRATRKDPAFGAWTRSRQMRLALLFCVLYAASDEFHQSFVPSREAAVTDVMLDSCGSAGGILAAWVVRKLRGKG
jgi:VanZ family protein